MTSQPTLAAPDLTASAAESDTEHHRRILNELADLGADLARLVHQQARQQLQAPAEPGPSPASNDNRNLTATDLTAAFDRIARTVRRTILLARSLDAPPRPQTAIPTRTATRKRIIRAVEDIIHRDARPAERESLHAELLDRLDAPEFADDIEGRPIAEIIREIRADLGLDIMPGLPPLKRRTPADLAILQARAAAPSRPATPGHPRRDPYVAREAWPPSRPPRIGAVDVHSSPSDTGDDGARSGQAVTTDRGS